MSVVLSFYKHLKKLFQDFLTNQSNDQQYNLACAGKELPPLRMTGFRIGWFGFFFKEADQSR